jgi:redox-sensitive bicupin YhaK (pirin superfamily)
MSKLKTATALLLLSASFLSGEMKKISRIYQPNFSHMVGDGFHVQNYFPEDKTPLSAFSPFILLDYNAPKYFPALKKGKRGVGAHPHRGFETVTLVYDGKLAHRDSAGHSGVIGAGDVQWMTAASGVLHEEFHEESFSRTGGFLHAVQLWVNLPKKHKMSKAKYQTLISSDVGKMQLDQKGSTVRVIAGKYGNVKGPASTFTPIEVYDVDLKAQSSFTTSLPQHYNSMILVLNGSIQVNDRNAKFKDLVLFQNAGEKIEITATEDSLFLVLSGEPIAEPVVQYGPFVMNTWEEIQQAEQDFQAGKFGRMESTF